MYVAFREIKGEKQELKTGKCRLVRRGRGRSSESGVHQKGGGNVEKVADDRGGGDLNVAWGKTWEKTALR